jgi:hypothetical protein
VYISMSDYNIYFDPAEYCTVCFDPLHRCFKSGKKKCIKECPMIGQCGSCRLCQCCKKMGCPGLRHHYTKCQFFGQAPRKCRCDCRLDPPGQPLGPIYPTAAEIFGWPGIPNLPPVMAVMLGLGVAGVCTIM